MVGWVGRFFWLFILFLHLRIRIMLDERENDVRLVFVVIRGGTDLIITKTDVTCKAIT